MIETRAVPAKPVDGKPAWYGQYRVKRDAMWLTAASGYGAICYMTPEAARLGADVHFRQGEAAAVRVASA